MKSFVLIGLLSFLFSINGLAQRSFNPIPFSGKVIDAQTKEPLAGANVILVSLRDSTRKIGAISDAKGEFNFPRLIEGMTMNISISFVGYETFTSQLKIEKVEILPVFEIKPSAEQLDEVKVTAIQTRMEMKGDTAQYNAAAFKVNQDANAQDLLTKLPGVVTQNGQIQAQGEQVKRVLVDGQEFFGDDPTLALKSLPAEVISQIQIFDRQSDQSQFTGFNDGNTEKTINIITRGGIQNGTFGRLFSAYGTEDRYQGGGNVNYFKGRERISIVGLTNNINQQNFSTEDLVGVAQAAQGSGSGRGRGGRGGSGANPNDFMIGQSAGINSTSSIGLNYSNTWNNFFKLNSSYFFNAAGNSTSQETAREFILDTGSNQYYNENSFSSSDNYNHRLALRGEYTIDKNNSIIFSPRLSYQDNSSNSSLSGLTNLSTNSFVNSLSNASNTENGALSLNSSILWRHRFEKPMRTLSLDFRTTINTRDSDSDLFSVNNSLRDTLITDQIAETISDTYTYSVSSYFTEPISNETQLFFSFTPQISFSKSNQLTNFKNELSGNYTDLQTDLSSSFDNTTLSQRGGTGVRWRISEKANTMINLDVQYSNLSGDQAFPTPFAIDKSFFNVLPGFMYSYQFERTSAIRVFYRTNTQLPSINQLQPVINNSNPLFLSTGNKNLNQQLNQSLFVRYNQSNTSSGTSFFLFTSGAFSNSYIGTSSVIATSDTTLSNGVVLSPGAQFSQPLNLEGYANLRSFGTFSMPSTLLKSTLNLNLGFTYSKTPSLINNAENITHSYNSNAGLTIASNISPEVDFTLGYNGNFVATSNSIQENLNANYYNGLASGKIQILLFNSLVLASDVNYSHFNGLGESFNQNFTLWNASIGYKFLKNNAAELRVSLFDILKSNRSINRNVTETYIEDIQTRIIRQYALVTFTYNLRSFTSGTGPTEPERRPPGSGGGWQRDRGM